MKRVYIITVISSLVAILVAFFILKISLIDSSSNKHIKIGFVYIGDESNPYTANFIRAEEAIREKYADQVDIVVKTNVKEGFEEREILKLVDEKCDVIFGTSYGYSETMKKMAGEYPEIQFVQATGNNANTGEKYNNYHTFMGNIYQGRYVSGVVAGMKLKEMIDNKEVDGKNPLVGYVAAYPYAEVISGYTAFLLGVRSVVPDVKMLVKYTESWSDFAKEKDYTEVLIEEGCSIISQHSDTTGPAIACENSDKKVYHVGYNKNMIKDAPTTSLISSRINWNKYMVDAVQAVIDGEEIEDVVKANINGNDAGAGFEEEWVQMMELNRLVAANGTKEKVDSLIDSFKEGKVDVFKYDGIGVDPFDESDTYDMSKGYEENKKSSAPTFHYVIKDIITVE